jgi:[protein-PII] uridylyltransferase
VDILFLHDTSPDDPARRELDEFVKQILYLLWDVGFKVGHTTRSIEGIIAHANADPVSKTSLLQARRIAGDRELAKVFFRRFEQACILGQEFEFMEWRRDDQRARFAKYGGSVFMQEPNVKFSPGGLRDLHNLIWSARFLAGGGLASLDTLAERKLLTRTEQRQLERAYDFLLRVRTELHHLVGRPGDVLTLAFQGQVATRFGYPQATIPRRSEAFMKDYYRHARSLHLITESVFERLGNETGNNAPSAQLPASQREAEKEAEESFDGFISRHGQLYAGAREIFHRDPFRLMRAFAYVQERGLTISPELGQLIRRQSRLVDRTFTYARITREIFLRILGERGKASATLRAMHEHGVLGRYLPEFGGLDCLVQHEFVHRYSADEHTLVCLEKLDALLLDEPTKDPIAAAEEAESYPAKRGYVNGYRKLFVAFADPVLLYLSLLLHDTGKATGARHHAEASALFAQKVAARLQLSPERRRALILLVDHHLTLSMTAQTRNLDDPATIGEFAGIVKNKENLDALMLVTFADGQGTTDQAWSDWKESLVWQLYRATVRYLAQGEAAYRREQQEREVQQQAVTTRLPESFAEEIDAHFHHMPARYFDTFDADQVAAHLILFRQFFGSLAQASGTGTGHGKEAGRPSIQPAIRWVTHPERGHTEVLIAGWKRRALLTKIAGSFSAVGLNILSADSFIRSDLLALEIFRVCDARRRAVSDARDIAAVERHLIASLAVEQFDFGPLLAKARRMQDPAYLGNSSRRVRAIRELVPLPTRILTRNDPASRFTLLEVQAADRLGLLYDLLVAINKVGVHVMLSRIATDKGAAFDSFYLTDRDGGRLNDADLLGRLRSGVREAALGE